MSLYTLDKHSDESLYNKIKNGVLELTSYFESMHNSGDVLSADRAFCQLTATLDTCEHVPTLQQHTVNRSIHTHFAQEVTLNSWEWEERGDITYSHMYQGNEKLSISPEILSVSRNLPLSPIAAIFASITINKKIKTKNCHEPWPQVGWWGKKKHEQK